MNQDFLIKTYIQHEEWNKITQKKTSIQEEKKEKSIFIKTTKKKTEIENTVKRNKMII